MWSVTSKPASLRMVWILLMISRIKPSSMSAGVSLVSSTTVTAFSLMAKKPSVCAVSMSRSSSVSFTSPDGRESVKTPVSSSSL